MEEDTEREQHPEEEEARHRGAESGRITEGGPIQVSQGKRDAINIIQNMDI